MSNNASALSNGAPARAADIRVDLLEIAKMIEPGSRVLDIGCGDGALMRYLEEERHVDARGMEISRQGVNACVAQGLSVIQGDANTDLSDYPTGAFDYVVLSQTLQAMHDTKACLKEMLRISNRAIVSFPNFGHWRVRLQLLVQGKMPETKTLEYPWYNTPNIHLCTIRDFVNLCRELGITIERSVTINGAGTPAAVSLPWWADNVFGAQGLFLLSYGGPRDDAGAPVYPNP